MSDMSTDSSLQPLMMPTPMPSSASAAAELDRFNEFFASCDTPTRGRLQKALDVIHRAIDLFGVDGVCFSFNGGKDSTVVLHLLRIVIAQREQQLLMEQNEPFKSAPPSSVSSPRQSLTQLAFPNLELEMCVKQQMQRVPVMYFDSHDQFPEVRDFIEQCTSRYSVSCHVYKCAFVEGVQDMLDKLKIKAIYMGVRGGDPHTEDLEHYSPSTPGWPAFLRINPILRWTYEDVWRFLRECDLEYCCLYDHGYTSLGNIYDTVQNPALWRSGLDGKEGYYLPAYELKDGSAERCGRQKKAHTTSKATE